VLSDREAMRLDFDAAVVSNLSPVHAGAREAQWRIRSDGWYPVIDLFQAAEYRYPAALAA